MGSSKRKATVLLRFVLEARRCVLFWLSGNWCEHSTAFGKAFRCPVGDLLLCATTDAGLGDHRQR